MYSRPSTVKTVIENREIRVRLFDRLVLRTRTYFSVLQGP